MRKDADIVEAYEKYADAIFRHCYFHVFDRDLAKDFMQETFVRVLKYRAEGNVIQNLRAFLYKTANNLMIDFLRRPRSSSLEHMQEKGVVFRQPDKGSLQEYAEAQEIIFLLDSLEVSYRQVVVMRYIDELKPKEIAEILGEGENTVSVRIHRGLQKVRQLLDSPHQREK